jgi:hypothetical protein
VGRELEWLLELPFEVQRQAHWNLVTCESVVKRTVVSRKKDYEYRRWSAHISFVGISN